MSGLHHVLLVGVSESDAAAIVHVLAGAGDQVRWLRVESADGLRSALARQAWDVVIADHRPPESDATSALATLKETGLDIPVIVVSEAITAAGAVAAMRAGARDVLTKAELTSLHSVVAREMAAASEGRKARRELEELRRSEEQFRLLVDGAPDAIFVLTRGTFAYANEAAATLFGAASPDALLDRPLIDLVHPESRSAARERMRRVDQQGVAVAPLEQTYLRLDGTTVAVEVSAVPLTYGNQARALVFVRDLSARADAEAEREKLQAQLLQAQKMESVGRLAGGVAHDFNNMLGAILGYAELTMQQLDPAQPFYTHLEEIRRAARRSADLTRQLLAFARKQTINPRVLDLNDAVSSMLKMLRRLIGEDVDLVWKPGPDLWPVNVDPTQIDQILANLSVNSRDAITGTGTLTIETANAVLDGAFRLADPDFRPGEYVRLVVRDDGCGMDSDTLGHLFEPFFTTKEAGKGTGLGTATVYGIVKQNGGVIDVESAPARGTSMIIHFPRAHAAVKTTAETESLTPATGTETILLVEDERAILDLGRVILQRLGYTVLPAASGTEAIATARQYDAPIHLLLTDVVLPGMNGKDLAEALAAFRPQVKVLFMSGYTSDVIAKDGVLQEGTLFLQKPFSVNEVATRVREVLNT